MFNHSGTVQACDEQTDKQTNGQTDGQAHNDSIASCGKKERQN